MGNGGKHTRVKSTNERIVEAHKWTESLKRGKKNGVKRAIRSRQIYKGVEMVSMSEADGWREGEKG